LKKRTIQPALCGRHFRLWENQRGVVGWDDQSKSRRAAQLLGQSILEMSAFSGGRRASGFIATKLAGRRWQVVAFAANRGIVV
jgi:hypothetical protein